ncbi:protein SUPPRESSOR OF GENE SILENCING 3-like [Silene latifolia]|uniref:protein SUPPRESSOR OF GENE SILENCING 3-like n=1 Tax=Silene latifolia TaxID=37657 RepID=UPI003D775305
MSSSRGIEHLVKGVNDINMGSSDDGAWEAVSRKQKNKSGRNAAKQLPQQASAPKAWGQPDTAKRLGMSSSNVQGNAWNTPSNDMTNEGGWGSTKNQDHPVTGPSRHGKNWASKSGTSETVDKKWADEEPDKVTDEEEDDDDDIYSEDDDDLLSDDYEEDDSPTHESKKQHRMLKSFFDVVDKLTVDEVNEPARQWHCPACQGGPGAIDWYKGLQPLVTHAKTKGTIRVKLHRMFADLLDEELQRKGTSAIPAGESFGQWEGLQKMEEDREIVWPPMVVIMNTLLEQDDNDKWLGMGNQELLDYFKDYAAVRAKHSYGPKGHRGMSVLIFDGSAIGYLEAERLHKLFLGQGTGRSAWESKRKVLFYPGGKRQLYGFLARKDDLEEFNRHCPGKTRLKYDMRSYKEKVLTHMKQMSEDNQQLTWYKSKAAKEQGRNKVLTESLNVVSEKLRKTTEENRIVRQRTTMQHEQNKEEMDFQEQFFNDQIQKIHEATTAKESKFEIMQQEERKKVEESKAHPSKMDDLRLRAEEVSKFKQFQEKEMEKFDGEREELIRDHEDRKLEMKKRHWEEELQLEKAFDAALTQLMGKYAPGPI